MNTTTNIVFNMIQTHLVDHNLHVETDLPKS